MADRTPGFFDVDDRLAELSAKLIFDSANIQLIDLQR
jgi:hypothetical protein